MSSMRWCFHECMYLDGNDRISLSTERRLLVEQMIDRGVGGLRGCPLKKQIVSILALNLAGHLTSELDVLDVGRIRRKGSMSIYHYIQTCSANADTQSHDWFMMWDLTLPRPPSMLPERVV